MRMPFLQKKKTHTTHTQKKPIVLPLYFNTVFMADESRVRIVFGYIMTFAANTSSELVKACIHHIAPWHTCAGRRL